MMTMITTRRRIRSLPQMRHQQPLGKNALGDDDLEKTTPQHQQKVEQFLHRPGGVCKGQRLVMMKCLSVPPPRKPPLIIAKKMTKSLKPKWTQRLGKNALAADALGRKKPLHQQKAVQFPLHQGEVSRELPQAMMKCLCVLLATKEYLLTMIAKRMTRSLRPKWMQHLAKKDLVAGVQEKMKEKKKVEQSLRHQAEVYNALPLVMMKCLFVLLATESYQAVRTAKMKRTTNQHPPQPLHLARDDLVAEDLRMRMTMNLQQVKKPAEPFPHHQAEEFNVQRQVMRTCSSVPQPKR
mmetsp:Transcript_20690/g.57153  ORF Transcript_20690/g.57153 Transcript_20690/m.57153 type:complete len:294 (-) Transcript_20690:2390-3271(-)